MHDNLHIPQAAFGALTGHAVIALEGPDSVAFAQAQFANDVGALPVGQWQWSAWLNPKGRVIALFMLCRPAEHTLWLVLADGRADTLAAQLQRFVFRRKVKVAVRADLHAGGRFDTPARAHGNVIDSDGDANDFDLGTTALPRTLRLSPHPFVEQPGLVARWREADLRLGLPRLDEGAVEQWTPQQIGLDRLAAYSVKKGCYPGQEIVARTHFLGKTKRVAQLVEVPPGTQAGAELRDGAQVAGTLASVAGALALAVLPIESEGLALQLGDAPVQRQPLLEGLAR
ncbi:folate-binding protein [Stenotrophomonas sp. HITSZ_GD]|uniref:CAF17-like 4Fe-4S cluster assembly/insertion protein YgfZ n=1 Tax=Stenotrophomonas sp. HITSZ_GD TaxID=3037248 RepID=UPI00240DACBA|nr:folate-binding protein [Stenotrophomonas sp. HITSZ_GD]MDG2524387.1 folate-binding protein [Stenotrophomonas sp. HITSZ_GD]